MRTDLIIGVLISALLHAGFLYGEKLIPKSKGPEKHLQKEEEQSIQMDMPPIEPDEEEKVEDMDDQPQENQLAPPSLIDMPTVVPVTAFTTPLQPPPPPGIEASKGAVTIPVTKPGAGFGKGIKDLFDIANLDQIPQARVQVQPNYPFEMRRAGISGEVIVMFIVGNTGDVIDAYAAKSTQREFEAPAVQAVMKWKFRPGRKGGKAVNTRMQVPIVFNLSDE